MGNRCHAKRRKKVETLRTSARATTITSNEGWTRGRSARRHLDPRRRRKAKGLARGRTFEVATEDKPQAVGKHSRDLRIHQHARLQALELDRCVLWHGLLHGGVARRHRCELYRLARLLQRSAGDGTLMWPPPCWLRTAGPRVTTQEPTGGRACRHDISARNAIDDCIDLR